MYRRTGAGDELEAPLGVGVLPPAFESFLGSMTTTDFSGMGVPPPEGVGVDMALEYQRG